MALILNTYDCGTVADTVFADLDNNGVLVLRGSGAVKDYGQSDVPWQNAKLQIVSLVVGKNITRLGNNNFVGCSNLKNIKMECNPPELGINVFLGVNDVSILYDPLLETWTSSVRVDNYGEASAVKWIIPNSSFLDFNGLTYLWNKIKIWAGNNFSKVTVTRNLSSGRKIGTITVDGQATELYCLTDGTGSGDSSGTGDATNVADVLLSEEISDLNTSNKTIVGSINELYSSISDVEQELSLV